MTTQIEEQLKRMGEGTLYDENRGFVDPDEVLINAIDTLRVLARHDDERAHRLQDLIYVSVLQRIAIDAYPPEDVQSMARLALTAQGVEFSRWYA